MRTIIRWIDRRPDLAALLVLGLALFCETIADTIMYLFT